MIKLFPLLLLCGCCTPGFVETQRAFFDVVEPEFRAYVESDPDLTPSQRKLRLDLLAAEEAALREAEGD